MNSSKRASWNCSRAAHIKRLTISQACPPRSSKGALSQPSSLIDDSNGRSHDARVVDRSFVHLGDHGSATQRHASAVQGIELVGPQSPDFKGVVTQIVGPDRPVGLAAALPYSLVIRNRRSQAIAAIDTVWTKSDRILLNAADTMFNKAILYVKPGQAELATPPGILQNQRQLRIFANGVTEGHRLENFQSPENVTVTVDSVVFESGQFVGANRYGAFERWQAQIQAPRDLATSVLQEQGRQSIDDVLSWLEGLAPVRHPPEDPHARETVIAARILLGAYRSNGEAGLYSRAKSILEVPAFPLYR